MSTGAIIRGSFAALLLCAAASSGWDQKPSATEPKGCAPGQRLQSGEASPRMPKTTGENLSDKLARNDGVLCPPNVDPEMKAPTPDTGKMPVIPPPGSPGGDPNVQPK
jgi:hypothetical protein